MQFFKRRKDLGLRLLGVWLIMTGVMHLIGLSFYYSESLMSLFAVGVGVLIVMGR